MTINSKFDLNQTVYIDYAGAKEAKITAIVATKHGISYLVKVFGYLNITEYCEDEIYETIEECNKAREEDIEKSKEAIRKMKEN